MARIQLLIYCRLKTTVDDYVVRSLPFFYIHFVFQARLQYARAILALNRHFLLFCFAKGNTEILSFMIRIAQNTDI